MRFKALIILFLVSIIIYPAKLFCEEAPRYKIKCFLNTQENILRASQEVTFTNNSSQAISSLYFHIYPNKQYDKEDINNIQRYGGYFKVDPFPKGFQETKFLLHNISSQGDKLNYSIEEEDKTLLKIDIPSLEPGKSITVTIDFQFNVPCQYGRFGQNQGIFALHRWYPILCVLDKEGWHKNPFYILHQPYFSEAALYDVEVTTPASEVVAHTADLLEEKNNSDNTKTVHLSTSLPVRDFSLAVSSRYKVVSEDYNGVKINSYYLSGDEFYGKQAITDAKDLMNFYTKTFGCPYPYKTFSMAPVYLAYGGHETSNMIFVDTRVYKLPKILIRYFDFLVAHETGHQWFQVLVGSDEFKEAWMDEGINSYFIGQYLNDKYGKDAQVMELPKYVDWFVPNLSFNRARTLRYIYAFKGREDHPVLSQLSSFQEPSSIFALTYGKGSAIVEMLRFVVGDETFNRIMKRYVKDFSFKNASFNDFAKIAEEESGKDLSWFYQEWLKTTGYLDYAVTQVKNGKVVIERRGENVMPVDVEIKLKDGTTTKVTLDGKEKREEIPVQDTRQIKRVAVDPQKRLLDVDKVNNFWPRQFEIRPVPYYYGIYDIDVFVPEDKYTLTFGPYADDGIGFKASVQKAQDSSIWGCSTYDFSESITRSHLGYEKKNVFSSLWDFGIEGYDEEHTESIESIHGGRIYLRRAFFPPPYGFFTTENHVTLYLLRDQQIEESFAFGEETQTQLLNYRKKDEAIVGLALNLADNYTYPDPHSGYKIISYIESAGHFMGADQYYNRGSLDLSYYLNVFNKFTLANRVFWGGGFPKDKELFKLGGYEGLRGYRQKSVRGSQAMLFTMEGRIPILKRLNLYAFDNIIGLEDIGLVLFFDGGKAWFNDFDEANFKKDVGVGIKFGLGIGGGMLEKMIVRLDVAKAIGDKEGTRVWIKFKQPF